MPAKVRGRAACNQCRSRKQKCDEERPICSRCRDLKKPCQWPGLRKRGPAKGYAEALEHRLRETERALLQIVSAVDGATMASAFRSSTQVAALPDAKAADKAEMAAYWERFPLSTPRDVMNWAQDFQRLRAAAAVGVTQPAGTQEDPARTAARLARPLHAHDAAMALGASSGERVANPAQRSATDVRHHLLPGASPDSDAQEGAFDMPEEFKEQYLW
ncbi:Zn(2)-C6 fungal-type DNA-binding domain protein [Cordyceps fumosorosea ARSEF 2679]|uniref:Zn(2)-C6 fungal-type DNA-binding domain protein n=1 Tax=Cordyceps fumosorosea (strain ARSEF 2679) TaxID=1081104 RepID=A0A167Q472_CORFA|nr:Zn(2)-C6 fungal-type DNA-binding domain protein [Cordyceps fumosorosea ARSEF 2679]OAA57268.1 Zn(2)-C6 fungal-type DNA-binding domain protein [Cordyceps fumosorosea ARSEF 2679]